MILPELARRVVATFSGPQARVVDPFAGVGTMLVEAAALGRHAAGIEVEPSWLSLAQTHLHATITAAATGVTAEAYLGDARRTSELLAGLAGRVDLVATAPPTPQGSAGLREPANLARREGSAYRQAMATVWAGCFRLLRPGGLLVTVTGHDYQAGRLQDAAATMISLARDAGFRYLQHIVALHAVVDDSTLTLDTTSDAWPAGDADDGDAVRHRRAHEDVCVLIKPPPDGEAEDGGDEAGD